MSGHSKWSQIKRKKGIKDVQKGQIFTKMSKLITLAVKEGGGIADPEKNFKLRLAVERAKGENMPKDSISRAIEKATGADSPNLKEVIYEGFAAGGVALLIRAATDNSNRTHSEVKNTLEKHGGKFGNVNSVAYLFEKCGLVSFDRLAVPEDKVFEFADRTKALDIDTTDDSYNVYIPFEKLGHVAEFAAGISPKSVEIDYRPKTTVFLDSGEGSQKIVALCHALEELDDVDRVFANFEIAKDVT